MKAHTKIILEFLVRYLRNLKLPSFDYRMDNPFDALLRFLQKEDVAPESVFLTAQAGGKKK